MKRSSICKPFGGIIAILLILAFAIFSSGAIANAAGTAEVSVSVPGEKVDEGEQFQVSISVAPDNDIAGMQFTLSFNPSLVTVDSVTEGNLFSQDGASTFFSPGVIDNNTGTLTAVHGAITSPGQTISTAGTFAVITFTAGTAGGICPLSLSDILVGDLGGNPVTFNVVNGSVIINDSPVIDHIGDRVVSEGDTLTFTVSAADPDGDSLTYSASSLPPGAIFNPALRNFSWTPGYDQSGVYSGVHFEVSDGSTTDSEDITITIINVHYSDLNNDGEVNVLDIIVIGQHWGETGSNGWITEDVNEDGTVNVLDVILIGQNWTA